VSDDVTVDSFPLDETAVIVPVPDTDPLVAPWRLRYDSSAEFGVPAHVTVLYPFIPFPALTGADIDQLRDLFGSVEPIDVTFARTSGFPGVLYLEPSPDTIFRQLTAAVADRWPQYQPYGGAHGEPTPHLTVTDSADEQQIEAIRQTLTAALPLTTTLHHAELIRFDGERWVVAERLPFHR
jgi:2'-5' RNA ligase superfamily